MVRVWLQIEAQPRSHPLHPLTVMYLPSFFPFFYSFYSFLLISQLCPVISSFCPSPCLTIYPPHLLLAPLCPTAVSVGDALDSVVVSALRHNLRLLGGAGPPVALRRRHSVCAHYRHNLLLSPVSKPRKFLPKNYHRVRATARGRGGD